MKRDNRFDELLFSEQFYNCYDEDLLEYQLSCVNEMNQYNNTPATKEGIKQRQELLKELFASVGKNCYIEPPVHANFGGKNVWIGDNFYANFNLVLVDDGKIIIGDNVMVGPNVTIATAEHPLTIKERNGTNNHFVGWSRLFSREPNHRVASFSYPVTAQHMTELAKSPERAESVSRRICHPGKVHAVCKKNVNASQTEKSFVRERKICNQKKKCFGEMSSN